MLKVGQANDKPGSRMERRENYFEQGVNALATQDYAAAVDALTRAYRLSLGDLAEVLLYRGEAYFCLGEYDRALEDFEESIDRNPRNPEAYNEHGNVLRFQGNYNAAIQDYSGALTLDPAHYEAWYNRALAYEAIGQSKEAESDLTHALELNPEILAAYEMRGRLRAARHDYTGAIDDFGHYLKMGGGREYDNQSEIQSQLITLRLTRFVLRLFRLYRS
jgi:tetratricopeptide (TPR) repeat protein